jgi:hypothetical protein
MRCSSRFPRSALAAPLWFALAGCVLDVPVGTLTDGGGAPELPEPPARVDVLLVVDNSGSMCEEQQALLDAFFGVDCPIQQLDQPGPYLNPSPEVAAELEQSCGLAQMLAAYDTDFRIGIITTDVGQCDNRYGFAESQPVFNCAGETVDWGRRPQRGCLQAPESWDSRWLSRGDGGLQHQFAQGLLHLGEHGSPFERGMDAVDVFVDDSPQKITGPGCENDGRDFLRPDAQLMVVFVTDEDDCSHADGAYALPDENVGESCDHNVEQFYSITNPDADASRCYSEAANLAPVAGYATRWRQRRPAGVSVFVLGGVDNGGTQPLACRLLDDGQITDKCWSSQGASSHTGPMQKCDPVRLSEQGIDQPCCTADGAPRYAELISAFDGTSDGASVCGDFGTALKRVRLLLP